MNGKCVIEALEKVNISCAENLKKFIEYYQNVVTRIFEEYFEEDELSEEGYMIKSYVEWLDAKGYKKIYDAIQRTDESDSDKINKFIELYSFLLDTSSSDVLVLINQLYTIPDEFHNLFGKRETIFSVQPMKVKYNMADAQQQNVVCVLRAKEVLTKASYLIHN